MEDMIENRTICITNWGNKKDETQTSSSYGSEFSIHSFILRTIGGMDVAGRLAIVSQPASPFVLPAYPCMRTQVYVHIWIWTLDNQWFRPFPLVAKLSLSHHRGPGMQYSTYVVVCMEYST